MSTLHAKLRGLDTDHVFEPKPKADPTPAPKHDEPGQWILIFGVICPGVVFALEAISHMCANSFFDPMPTYWHAAAVAFVPASNLFIWCAIDRGALHHSGLLAFINGITITIAGFYALLFLPLTPIAIIALVMVIGAFPLTPLASFIAACRLAAHLAERRGEAASWRPIVGGLFAGLVIVFAIDIPSAMIRTGFEKAASLDDADRAYGFSLLRTFAGEEMLRGLAYGEGRIPTALLSAAYSVDIFGGRSRGIAVSPATAREIYYRLYGEPFNAKPAPLGRDRVNTAAFRFDEDLGGTQVGGRIPGLRIIGSRLDGSISGDDALAYLEWTIELRNADPIDREARLQFALPPGAVVSRATLWVNGEEREAAYGGRGEVRAAYQRVAVRQRRDPLLVTTKGGDRVLAQAFPVPRGGGTLKFKIGITAPLDLTDRTSARLALPAILDRNVGMDEETAHALWIESRQPLAIASSTLAARQLDPPLYRVTGTMRDGELFRARPVVTVRREGSGGARTAQIADGELIVQEIGTDAQPDTLMLVVDGSARLAGKIEPLIKALDAIPAELKVGVIVAAERLQRIEAAPASPQHKRAVAKLLRSVVFTGGQDNSAALVFALEALEQEKQAALLWVHGPQPVAFQGSAMRLEQAAARLARFPKVVLYAVEPGPNEVLPDAPLAWSARLLPQTGTLQADLSAFFARLGDPAVLRTGRAQQGLAPDGAATGSEHVARLWANEHVLDLMRQDARANRAQAVALATRYRLVTPVSGAVVLETQQQYQESGLTPVSAATVPTVPEPHEWALMILAAASLLWLMWRRQQLGTVA